MDGDVIVSTHIGDTFLGGSIGIGLLPELKTPGVEHDLIRIKHVLRRRVELQYDTRVPTSVVDEALGCLDNAEFVGDHQSAIREEPLDLRAHERMCTHISRQ